MHNNKSPNDAYDFSKLFVFSSIWYALQPSNLLHELGKGSAKKLFLGIDPAGYKALDQQSNAARVPKTVKVFAEKNHIQGLC